jgi:hypothetical protein
MFESDMAADTPQPSAISSVGRRVPSRRLFKVGLVIAALACAGIIWAAVDHIQEAADRMQ